MKIVHVVHCYPPEPVGGTERVVASLTRGLALRGHEVHVIAGSLDWVKGFGVDQDTFEGVPVTRIHRDDPWFDRWENGYHPGVEQLYRELLRELKPDLVHIHHWIRMTRNLVQLTREEGIPSVVQLHDFHTSCPRTFRLTPDRTFCDKSPSIDNCIHCVQRWPFQGDAEVSAQIDQYLRDMRNELRCANRILTLSEAQAQFIRQVMPQSAGKIDVLPPGTPVELSPRPAPEPSETLRVIHWGNLFNLKGVMHLIDAVALAANEVPIHLTIRGRATQPVFKARLEEKVKDLPVTLGGAFEQHDLENCDADLAVFPSLCYETYSLVVDEALMLGLPVIVSDLGAPSERIGEGGLVVPAGDVRALADQLIRLAKDRAALAKLTEEVKSCNCSLEDVAERAEHHYQQVIDGNGDVLPLEDPVTSWERLSLYWFTAGQRLLSLAGSNVSEPPLGNNRSKFWDYLNIRNMQMLSPDLYQEDSSTE